MDEEKQVKQELYNAIIYFIERQELVVQSIVDLGLDIDLIGRFGAMAWVPGTWVLDDEKRAWLDRLDESFVGEDALIEAIKRSVERRYPQRGSWGEKGEWEYYLHGNGCLLTNKETWEQIDWDCPNPKAFDLFFFQTHLEWQLTSSARKHKLRHTIMWVETNGIDSVQGLVKKMAEEGILEVYQTMGGPNFIVS